MKDSFLNPGIPTSHVRGWTSFEDATGTRMKVVHSWWGDWTNESGEIVSYILRYDYPKKEQPDLELLNVTAIYMSKEKVDEYISLRPIMKKEQERIENQESNKIKRKIAKIRQEAKQLGQIAVCLVDSQAFSNLTEIGLDSAIPPLSLNVASAKVKNDHGDYSSIEIVFTSESAKKIKQFTTKHLNQNIAIIVAGKVVSAPLMFEPIGDVAMITGAFTPERAQEIAMKIMSK